MTRQHIALLLLTTTLSACLTTHRVPMVHKIRVTTTPANAAIWREDKAGRQAVGHAPFLYEARYEKVTRKVTVAYWVTWVGMILASAGGFVVGALSDDTATRMLGYLGGGVFGSLAALVPMRLFAGDEDLTPSAPLTLGASSPGYSDGWLKVRVPPPIKNGQPRASEQKIHITLVSNGKTAGSKAVASPTTTVAPAAAPNRPIVAVFDLADSAKKLDAATVGSLTEYLATQLTATRRYRTVPRSQLRKRLRGEKRQSYKTCFDEACQIELGKALAAQKSLATKIIRVGEICTLASVLYDLKTETSERAATTEGGCSKKALLVSLRAQAKKLVGLEPAR